MEFPSSNERVAAVHLLLPVKETDSSKDGYEDSRPMADHRQGHADDEKANVRIGMEAMLKSHHLCNDDPHHGQCLAGTKVAQKCPFICCDKEG